MHGDINIRLGIANCCLYGLKTLFKSKLSSRKTKEILYMLYPTCIDICMSQMAKDKGMMKNYVYLEKSS